jgi:hypothetical protein
MISTILLSRSMAFMTEGLIHLKVFLVQVWRQSIKKKNIPASSKNQQKNQQTKKQAKCRHMT